MFVEVSTDIWIVEGGLVDFYSCPYPTRMVVVRLPSGQLWVWSPIELTDELKARVDALGQVAHLVSPNKIHHLFLTPWQQAYPDAKLWGPQSTIDKRPDLNFSGVLEASAPNDWENVFDQVWFNGSCFMDEVVFFHRPSKTVIMADLSENFSQAFLQKHWKSWQRFIARLWGIVEGRGYAPLEWRLSFWKRKETRQAKELLLSLPVEKVIMAHGQWQADHGHAFLEKSLSWI
ncbi:MAG: DUF4336 domain-containing protein [Methylocystaceae bacterium]|nr:DUF4336 domain-containing protein [Methylocystaceae bacterium]